MIVNHSRAKPSMVQVTQLAFGVFVPQNLSVFMNEETMMNSDFCSANVTYLSIESMKSDDSEDVCKLLDSFRKIGGLSKLIRVDLINVKFTRKISKVLGYMGLKIIYLDRCHITTIDLFPGFKPRLKRLSVNLHSHHNHLLNLEASIKHVNIAGSDPSIPHTHVIICADNCRSLKSM